MVTLVNGVLPISVLREVPWAPGKYVRYDVIDSLVSLNKAFRARFGINLDINEGYRDLSTQKAYYKNPPSGVGTAAVPGTSNHGWGLAIDFGGLGGKTGAMYLWMRVNAPNYGWNNPLWARDGAGVEEPWHWESAKAKNVVPDVVVSTNIPTPVTEQEMKDQIIAIYLNRVGSLPSPDGLSFWLSQIALGHQSLASLDAALAASQPSKDFANLGSEAARAGVRNTAGAEWVTNGIDITVPPISVPPVTIDADAIQAAVQAGTRAALDTLTLTASV